MVDNPLEDPPFSANSFTTAGWPSDNSPGTGNVEDGAGTLVYRVVEKSLEVILTDFVVYHADIFNVDYFSSPGPWPIPDHYTIDGPDGTKEMAGKFTLKVQAYTPTCEEQSVYLDADIVPDCYVNLVDFAAFASEFLNCNNPRDLACP